MRAAIRIALILSCTAAILACGIPSIALPSLGSAPTAASVPPTTAPAIIVPATGTSAPPTEPATAIPPTATVGSPEGATGVSVSYENLRFVIPDGLGTDTTNSSGTTVEFPYINPSNGDMPQHLKIVINGYPNQGTLLEPQVMVFPAAQYGQYTDASQQLIDALHGSQFMDGQPLPAGLPAGVFNAHVQKVQFANGSGIRYITQFDQAVLPVNNHEMIYYFHGLTGDGNTYVEVILPPQASFLAPDENPASPLPDGGIPFNMDDPTSYFQAVADKLNATPPDQFSPSLSRLDALIQSIAIK